MSPSRSFPIVSNIQSGLYDDVLSTGLSPFFNSTRLATFHSCGKVPSSRHLLKVPSSKPGQQNAIFFTTSFGTPWGPGDLLFFSFFASSINSRSVNQSESSSFHALSLLLLHSSLLGNKSSIILRTNISSFNSGISCACLSFLKAILYASPHGSSSSCLMRLFQLDTWLFCIAFRKSFFFWKYSRLRSLLPLVLAETLHALVASLLFSAISSFHQYLDFTLGPVVFGVDRSHAICRVFLSSLTLSSIELFLPSFHAASSSNVATCSNRASRIFSSSIFLLFHRLAFFCLTLFSAVPRSKRMYL